MFPHGLKKSGTVFCGQSSNQSIFSQKVDGVFCCLLLGCIFYRDIAHAAICFLPDCAEKVLEFQGGDDETAKACRESGYELYSNLVCSEYSKIEYCPSNPNYIKCNDRIWCIENGYNVPPDTCNIPKYPDEKCPNNQPLYKSCVIDYERACNEEDEDYVSECEALGYRSTSCVGGGVKCPWDLTKMYCNPNMCSLTITKEMCDAECKNVGEQSCLKDGVTYYAQCGASKCAEGQGCKAGACVNCDNSCSVGNILYADYSCNSCIMEGKTAIGVIGYVKGTSALAVYLKQSSSELEWASLTDFPTLTNYSSTSTAIKDYSGRENTFNWALFYGHTNTWNGPGYCNTLTTSGTSKRQWYLPALGELFPSVWTNRVAVKKGLKIAGGDKLERGNYISSSEYIDSANWAVYAELGSIKPRSKNGFEYLRCVLAF